MATNIRFQGIVKTTAEMESDKFAGRIGFNTTLARFVAYYNATQYATMARRDVLETFALGIQDSTQTAGRLTYATTGGRLAGDAGLTYGQTGGITRTLNVGNGSVAADVGHMANGASGFAKLFYCRTGGINRWVYGASNDAESGADAGSKFVVSAYADGGTKIDEPIAISRATGGTITLGGAEATKRDVNLTKDLQLSGTTRISAAGRIDCTSKYNTATAGLGIRPLATDNNGMEYAPDAATFRGIIGAQHRNEAVNTTVTYPGPNGGYFLLSTATETAIPANQLVEGLVVRMKAYVFVSVDSGIYFDVIGALSDASTGTYPSGGAYDTEPFAGSAGGNRWVGFLSGKIQFTVEIRLGAITSGTTRRVHYIWSAQSDGLAPQFWGSDNFSLDVSVPRYPHLAIDLAGNGSINKYVYSVEIQKP